MAAEYFEVATQIAREAGARLQTHAVHPDVQPNGPKWGLVSARCGKPVKWCEQTQTPTCPRCQAELVEDAKGCDF